ncbi:MAG: 2Fe-2S iron-sulfur cluster-binding protein [Pseudomonadota bacterium]
MIDSQRIATLEIVRGSEELGLETVAYELPFEDGASILDGLMWLKTHREPSLAFRFSCINANVCRECTMVIDGETTYACTARLRPGVTKLEPLPNRRHIRDLVTETVPRRERLIDD